MASMLEELAAKGVDISELLDKLRGTAAESERSAIGPDYEEAASKKALEQELEAGKNASRAARNAATKATKSAKAESLDFSKYQPVGGSRMATPAELESLAGAKPPSGSLKVLSELPVPTMKEAGFSMPNDGVIETTGRPVGTEVGFLRPGEVPIESKPSFLSRLSEGAKGIGTKLEEMTPKPILEGIKGVNYVLKSPAGKVAGHMLNALEPLAIGDIASGKFENDMEDLVGYNRAPSAKPGDKNTPVPAIAGEINPKTGKPFGSGEAQGSQPAGEESDDDRIGEGAEYTGPQSGDQQEEGAKYVGPESKSFASQPEQPSSASDIKKMLSGGEDYASELRRLQQNQLNAHDTAQYGRLGEILASGITGIVDRGTASKPVLGEYFKNMEANAAAPIEQLKQRIEMEKHDPKSQISQLYRNALKKMKIDVPEDATAGSMEKAFPVLEKIYAADMNAANKKLVQEQANYYKQARLNLSNQALDERTRKQVGTAAASLSNKLVSGGGAVGNQIRQSIINAKNMFNTVGVDPNITNKDIDKLNIQDLDKKTKLQIVESAIELNRMLSNSAVPAQRTLAKLIPNNLKMMSSDALSFVSGKMEPAKQGPFVKDILRITTRIRDTAKENNTRLLNNYLLGGKYIKEKDPETWKALLDEHGVSDPFEKTYKPLEVDVGSPKEESKAGPRPSPSPQGGLERKVVKKGYNPSTNQTQLIYSDGTKEIVPGKQ